MADDGKRSEVVSTKLTERMALDLMHEAAREDRSVCEFIYLLIRKELYGRHGRRDSESSQSTK